MRAFQDAGRSVMRFGGAALLAALAVIGGCTTDPGFSPPPGVRAVEAGDVAACSYVSNLSISPSVFGPLAGEGLKYSRNRILGDAAQMGANAVVFDKIVPGDLVTRVTATAYRC